MLKNVDVMAGCAVFFYTVMVVILRDQGIADLGAYLAQPELSGPFAVLALARGYSKAKAARGAKAVKTEAPRTS